MAKKQVEIARNLRKQVVPAEARLWRATRDRRLGGFKFRRQVPVGPYFADFACVELQLIVEADGESHVARTAEDRKRTQYLTSSGWHVIRFWNPDVFDDFETVKEAIYQECMKIAQKKSSPPSPLSPGTPGERGRG